MYSYTVSKTMDVSVFTQTCALIASKITGLKKEPLLEDVDGTQIQIYRINVRYGGGKIEIVNDYEVDAVYVDSDINLDNILEGICVLKHTTD